MVNRSDKYIEKKIGTWRDGSVMTERVHNPYYKSDSEPCSCCDDHCTKRNLKIQAIVFAFVAVSYGIYALISYLTHKNHQNDQRNSTITTPELNLTSDTTIIYPFNATTNFAEVGSIILSAVRQVYMNVTNTSGN